jgi:hypothetical protein
MSTVTRQPKGIPVGGQFADSKNPEATVALTMLDEMSEHEAEIEDAVADYDQPLILGEPDHRPRRPYERRIGSKYEETKDLGTTEIAARIRQDIKDAVARGDLPSDANISVKTDKFAGGSAIRIDVSNWPGATKVGDESLCTGTLDIGNGLYPSHCKDGNHDWRCAAAPHASDAAEAVQKTIQAIHDSYNYDGSDMMTDYFNVRYYGQVKVDEYRAPVIDPSLAPLKKTGTMADLKRVIKVGTVLEVVQNPNWPASVGMVRPVVKAQTGSFAMRTRKPGATQDTASWMDFGRASELTYDKAAGEFQLGDVRFKILDDAS